MSVIRNHIEDLLFEIGRAHHEAFTSTAGKDPDWPAWYAQYLKPKLEALLSQNFTESEIQFWLIGAQRDHESEAPNEPWTTFYAKYILDQLHIE